MRRQHSFSVGNPASASVLSTAARGNCRLSSRTGVADASRSRLFQGKPEPETYR